MRLVKSTAQPRKTTGFTLIELLVVIAIIALLAAIILPVFSTVRENGRQTNSMSNLHDISTKLEQYKLDTHAYPPVLFGYAVPTAVGATTYEPMDKALDYCTNAANNVPCSIYLPGLYPEYINNYTEFQDPDNTVDDLSKTTSALSRLFLCAGNNDPNDDTACGTTLASEGELVKANGTLHNGNANPLVYYEADAYDVSPQVNQAGTNINSTVYIPRYQTSWTSIYNGPPDSTFPGGSLDCSALPRSVASVDECGSNTSKPDFYLNQMRWRNPPAGTYVTCTTDHVVPARAVLVLTQDGSVAKIGSPQFGALDYNVSALSVDANGVGSAKFWQISN